MGGAASASHRTAPKQGAAADASTIAAAPICEQPSSARARQAVVAADVGDVKSPPPLRQRSAPVEAQEFTPPPLCSIGGGHGNIQNEPQSNSATWTGATSSRARGIKGGQDAETWTCGICSQRGNEGATCPVCHRPKGAALNRSYETVNELAQSVVHALNGRDARQDGPRSRSPAPQQQRASTQQPVPRVLSFSASSPDLRAFDHEDGRRLDAKQQQQQPERGAQRGFSQDARRSSRGGGQDFKRVTWSDTNSERRRSNQAAEDTCVGVRSSMAMTDNFSGGRGGGNGSPARIAAAVGAKAPPPVPAVPQSLPSSVMAEPLQQAAPVRIGDRMAGPSDGIAGPPIPAPHGSGQLGGSGGPSLSMSASAPNLPSVASAASQGGGSSRPFAEMPPPPPLPAMHMAASRAKAAPIAEKVAPSLPRQNMGPASQDLRRGPVETRPQPHRGSSPQISQQAACEAPTLPQISNAGRPKDSRPPRQQPASSGTVAGRQAGTPAGTGGPVRSSASASELPESVDVAALLQAQLANLERVKSRIGTQAR